MWDGKRYLGQCRKLNRTDSLVNHSSLQGVRGRSKCAFKGPNTGECGHNQSTALKSLRSHKSVNFGYPNGLFSEVFFSLCSGNCLLHVPCVYTLAMCFL